MGVWKKGGPTVRQLDSRTNKLGRSLPPLHRTAVPPLLEGRTQAEGPVALEGRPLLRDRVVDPQDHDSEHVHPRSGAEGLARGPDVQGIIPRIAVPLHGARVVPRHTHVIEQGALDGRETGRQEGQATVQQGKRSSALPTAIRVPSSRSSCTQVMLAERHSLL